MFAIPISTEAHRTDSLSLRRALDRDGAIDHAITAADFEQALTSICPSTQRANVVDVDRKAWDAIGGYDHVKQVRDLHWLHIPLLMLAEACGPGRLVGRSYGTLGPYSVAVVTRSRLILCLCSWGCHSPGLKYHISTVAAQAHLSCIAHP
jgi:hypothetical protein